MQTPIPLATTGDVYAPCIANARAWIVELVERAQRLRDPEFEREAQRMLDCLDAASEDARTLIERAEGNCEKRRAA